MSTRKWTIRACAGLALGLGIGIGVAGAQGFGERFGFGSAATPADIAKIDIDVMPDGRGAPAGQGTVDEGMRVYNDKCAACHGENLGGVKGTGAAPLVGGRGTLDSGKPKKTVESYYPYASTLFDYTKRAMPFNAPGTLTDNEVYAVVAYILNKGNIIDKSTVMNAKTLAAVKMPNRNGFIFFPGGGGHRPDVRNYR